MTNQRPQTLLIACGALARELKALIRINHWSHLKLRCLPARLHNSPGLIPDAVQEMIVSERRQNPLAAIVVAYADCGTGGRLDRMLARNGVQRLAGAHCYEFFAGEAMFSALHEAEPGTFYLTDFLARHFERLIMSDLGLNDHPELIGMMFGNYRRLVFLDQSRDAGLLLSARNAAEKLGLKFEHRPTGLEPLSIQLRQMAHVVPIFPAHQA